MTRSWHRTAFDERTRTAHDRQRAHRPGVVVAVARGLPEARATFQSAIDRMEEYPEFVFTCDSVVYLRIEESDPELFAKIRERVAEGRFQVIGGWWVEPDCNIPCGESYVRQALYGQRWLHDRFGVTATTEATSTRSATTRCCRSSSARAGSIPTSSSGRARTSSSCPVSASGGSRRTARECRIPDPARVLQPARRHRPARREGARAGAGEKDRR